MRDWDARAGNMDLLPIFTYDEEHRACERT